MNLVNAVGQLRDFVKVANEKVSALGKEGHPQLMMKQLRRKPRTSTGRTLRKVVRICFHQQYMEDLNPVIQTMAKLNHCLTLMLYHLMVRLDPCNLLYPVSKLEFHTRGTVRNLWTQVKVLKGDQIGHVLVSVTYSEC